MNMMFLHLNNLCLMEVSAEFEKSLAKELFEHITNAIALEGKMS